MPRGIAVRGPLSVSTPGLLAGIAAMHAAHGTLPWRQLCGPAIAHARDGFAVIAPLPAFRRRRARGARRGPAVPRGVPGGLDVGVPPLAALIRQPDLARTLEEIAQDGAETFYRGALAKRLAAGMREAGVLVDERDLAECQPQVQDPIGIAYRGFRVTQTPPNSTGFTMLQMLKIVERFDFAALDPVQRIHVLVEAKKRAFLDRERYGTDPRFGDVPLDRLLSDAYADECAAAIDMARAATPRLAEPEAAVGDTTYFCVVDAEGNAVSGIQSINSGFGSGVTAGDTGVLLNNRMAYWHLAPGHANRLAPGKRVRHTMNAPMVFKDDALWAVEGTPGADNQVQVNLQVLTAMMDLGADPQTALEAPRWTSIQRGQGANWPHEGDGRLTIEPEFGEEVLPGLERLGHRLNRVGPLEGAVQRAGDPGDGERRADGRVRSAARRLGGGVLKHASHWHSAPPVRELCIRANRHDAAPVEFCLDAARARQSVLGRATSCWAAAWPAWCRRSRSPIGAGPARSSSRSASPGPT